jgi:prepilin-type N-terminal cleavage/methylation domain-containing protein
MIRHPSSHRTHGFSLIELLVVMGIMVAMVAGFSLALRGGGTSGFALQSAQSELAALLGAARASAVLHHTSARLLISAAPPPQGDAEKYLRCLQVAREEPAESGRWVAEHDPVYLPRGIFMVPPTVPASHLAPGVSWPGGQFAPVSALAAAASCDLNGRNFGEAYAVEYAPDGRPDPAVGKLVLATARPSRDSFPRFDNPSAVRGLRLFSSGSIGWVNRADNF